MSDQLSLDDLPTGPSARPTDPPTSAAAAGDARNAVMGVGVLRLWALQWLDRADAHGLTDFELADLMGRQQTSAGKRRGELRDNGLVVDSGMKRPAPSGSLAIVWAITDLGRARLRSMAEHPAVAS